MGMPSERMYGCLWSLWAEPDGTFLKILLHFSLRVHLGKKPAGSVCKGESIDEKDHLYINQIFIYFFTPLVKVYHRPTP